MTERFEATRRILRRVAAGALLAALTACAGLKPAPNAPTNAPAANAAAVRTNASYHGRFAVRYTDSNGVQRNAYGNFDLQQQGESATLQLLNPLGQTMARVVASPSGATLELPDRPTQTAQDVEGLMQRALGFPLPIDGLRYWLKPAISPDSPARTQTDPATGRMRQIEQDGWTIDYVAYADDAQTALIKRVDLSRDDPALDVKLVLDR
jgi:outer membrane lipoprotein LolB